MAPFEEKDRSQDNEITVIAIFICAIINNFSVFRKDKPR